MGLSASTMNSLQILKVLENSVSHKNNILPFVHTIVGFNGKPIQSKDDALVLNREWEKASLKLELMDMRISETFILEIPKKHDVRLGISVKFHPKVTPLLSMEILRISPDSPAERSGIIVGDYILGIENLSSDNEDDLLGFIDKNKEHIVPLLVYNHELGYVRVVDLQVGADMLFGCQIGIGELYKVPYKLRWGRIEFDVEIIDKDIQRLKDKQREGVFIDNRAGEEEFIGITSVNIGGAEESTLSGISNWTPQQQTPMYYPEYRETHHVFPSEEAYIETHGPEEPLNIPLLDLEDVNDIPALVPNDIVYEVPVEEELETEDGIETEERKIPSPQVPDGIMDDEAEEQQVLDATIEEELEENAMSHISVESQLEEESPETDESVVRADKLKDILEDKAGEEDNFDLDSLPLVGNSIKNEEEVEFNLSEAYEVDEEPCEYDFDTSPREDKYLKDDITVSQVPDEDDHLFPIENGKMKDISSDIKEMLSKLKMCSPNKETKSVSKESLALKEIDSLFPRAPGSSSSSVISECTQCPLCLEPHQSSEEHIGENGKGILSNPCKASGKKSNEELEYDNEVFSSEEKENASNFLGPQKRSISLEEAEKHQKLVSASDVENIEPTSSEGGKDDVQGYGSVSREKLAEKDYVYPYENELEDQMKKRRSTDNFFLDKVKDVGERDYPHSEEEESSGTTDVGSPPYSDPGSIL